MKLYEIEHINEALNPNKVMGLQLIFTHCICPLSGERRDALYQPEDWDNVKRLTNMLFLAWDDKNPLEGSVYVGKLV